MVSFIVIWCIIYVTFGGHEERSSDFASAKHSNDPGRLPPGCLSVETNMGRW